MPSKTVKITSKGQITIPKEVRKKLGADTVYFEVAGDVIMLKPVLSAAGSLREFAKQAGQRSSFRRVRDRAWEEAVGEKHAKRS